MAAKAHYYCIIDGILYFINSIKRKCRLGVVPKQLQKRIMEESHVGPLVGHYSGNWLHNILSNHWYWDGMYTDAIEFCISFPQCVIVSGG